MDQLQQRVERALNGLFTAQKPLGLDSHDFCLNKSWLRSQLDRASLWATAFFGQNKSKERLK